MNKNPYIQYNSSNKDYARFNRNHPTKAEKLMRDKILKKKQSGYLFLRQKMLGSFIADFYCSELLLVIEIDGNSHDQKKVYDINRTDSINDFGIIVIRYDNEDVLGNINGVRYDLSEQLKKRQKHINLIHKNFPPGYRAPQNCGGRRVGVNLKHIQGKTEADLKHKVFFIYYK